MIRPSMNGRMLGLSALPARHGQAIGAHRLAAFLEELRGDAAPWDKASVGSAATRRHVKTAGQALPRQSVPMSRACGQRSRSAASATTVAKVTVGCGPAFSEHARGSVQPFLRLDDARNRTKVVPIGLAIARDIARFDGGDIALAMPIGGLRGRFVSPCSLRPAASSRSAPARASLGRQRASGTFRNRRESRTSFAARQFAILAAMVRRASDPVVTQTQARARTKRDPATVSSFRPRALMSEASDPSVARSIHSAQARAGCARSNECESTAGL